MAFEHKSVLLEEVVNGLNIKPDGIYVDGTLGGGGHAFEVCKQLSDKGSFIGIDQDAAAIEAAGIRLRSFGEKVTIVRSNYCDMKLRLKELGIDKGLSSIWAYRLISWIRQSVDSHTQRMRRLICGWTPGRQRQPLILSMDTVRWTFFASFVITEKIDLRRTSQSTL